MATRIQLLLANRHHPSTPDALAVLLVAIAESQTKAHAPHPFRHRTRSNRHRTPRPARRL